MVHRPQEHKENKLIQIKKKKKKAYHPQFLILSLSSFIQTSPKILKLNSILTKQA